MAFGDVDRRSDELAGAMDIALLPSELQVPNGVHCPDRHALFGQIACKTLQGLDERIGNKLIQLRA